MAVIHIDGKTVDVDGADNLLQACLSLGIDVPYFCYHPALGAVGSCRQCAVKQYNNADDYAAGKGRLIMSCMVNPTQDMYISVDDDEAKAFRASVVEFLMTNHPHDCPTCEEGGHCHLQDMTYMSGHNRRKYRFTKRTHQNQDLGPFINHEMNRCIACYRCVRYYKDYAGGEDLGVYASSNRVYFGRDKDGQFESEFSGNLTEICPTGVFTDKTHSERYNRKWDMQYAPSICHGCSAGCNISAGERYGELRRIENRYNGEVNSYFLCDRGRFGYGYVNRDDRHIQPLERLNNKQVKVSLDYAIDSVTKRLQGKKVIGIGSPMASLESNFALKQLVGQENYATGLSPIDQGLVEKCIEILTTDGIYNPAMREIETYDAVLVLGEDITQTSPRIALSVRQSAKNKAISMATALKTQEWLAEPVQRIGQKDYSPIFVLDVKQTKLDDIAKASCVATPQDIADMGFAIAEHISQLDTNKLPKDLSIDISDNLLEQFSDMQTFAKHIAQSLLKADKPLVISGTALQHPAIIEAAAQITQQLSQKRQLVKTFEQQYVVEQNMGIDAEIAKINAEAALKKAQEDTKQTEQVATENANLAPATKPAEVKLPERLKASAYTHQAGLYLSMPYANSVGVCLLGGKPLNSLLEQTADAIVVLENDLAQLLPANKLEQLFMGKTVLVLDHQNYAWHTLADVVLPAASFAEADGTLVSAEGRAQRFFQVYDPAYYNPQNQVKESWRWLHAIAADISGIAMQWTQLDDVIASLTKNYPQLAAIANAAPNANYRISGLKIAREPRRYSGRTAMRAPLSVHEPMQPKDIDTGLTFSMEGYVGNQTDSAMIPFAWSPGWNSPQAWNKYQDKVGGHLKNGDPGVRLFDMATRLPQRSYVLSNHKPPIANIQTVNGQYNVQLVPMYNIFASGELESRSPIIAGQLIAPAFSLSEADAHLLGVKQGDLLAVTLANQVLSLPVQLVDYLPENCIGYPVGQSHAITQAVQAVALQHENSSQATSVTTDQMGETA